MTLLWSIHLGKTHKTLGGISLNRLNKILSGKGNRKNIIIKA
jgi:hypothetical protein